MGSSRTRNFTRAGKARSVKPFPKPRRNPTRSPAAMKKRLEVRKPVAGLGTMAVDALREIREHCGPIDPRALAIKPKGTRRKPANGTEEELFAIPWRMLYRMALAAIFRRSSSGNGGSQ